MRVTSFIHGVRSITSELRRVQLSPDRGGPKDYLVLIIEGEGGTVNELNLFFDDDVKITKFGLKNT